VFTVASSRIRRTRIVGAAALLCTAIAVGAAMQGPFTFTGPRWLPKVGNPTSGGARPAPPPTPQSETQHPQAIHTVSALSINETAFIVSLIIVAVALTSFLLWRWLRKRSLDVDASRTPTALENLDNDTDAPLPQGPDLPTLRRGLALAHDELSGDREPRDAIVRAWLGLQEAAEDSGVVRSPAETPTEFTHRVFAAVHADRAAAATLLELYLRVRFGSRPATTRDVDAARQAIAELTVSWPELQRSGQ
jgi:hypothetical protein